MYATNTYNLSSLFYQNIFSQSRQNSSNLKQRPARRRMWTHQNLLLLSTTRVLFVTYEHTTDPHQRRVPTVQKEIELSSLIISCSLTHASPPNVAGTCSKRVQCRYETMGTRHTHKERFGLTHATRSCVVGTCLNLCMDESRIRFQQWSVCLQSTFRTLEITNAFNAYLPFSHSQLKILVKWVVFLVEM